MTAALLIFVVLALAWVIYAIRKTETAPLHEDWDVPVREALTGPKAEESERPAMFPHKAGPVTPDRPSGFTPTVTYIVIDASRLMLDPDIDALCKQIEEGKI